MSVIQINLWTCEVCGRIETTVQETYPWSDPVVESPGVGEWNYIKREDEELLACPECLAQESAPKEPA